MCVCVYVAVFLVGLFGSRERIYNLTWTIGWYTLRILVITQGNDQLGMVGAQGMHIRKVVVAFGIWLVTSAVHYFWMCCFDFDDA